MAPDEETNIEAALEALEGERFWSQAEAAAAWRRTRSDAERQRIAASDASIDAAFDGLD